MHLLLTALLKNLQRRSDARDAKSESGQSAHQLLLFELKPWLLDL